VCVCVCVYIYIYIYIYRLGIFFSIWIRAGSTFWSKR
jgi:hypothetical protein